MKHMPHISGTRDQMNGVRKLPHGVMVKKGIENENDAWEKAKSMEKKSKNGETFHVSGVGGNYCILKYGAKLEPDPAYLHMT